MRVLDIIQKKRDGLSLDLAEIEFFVRGFTTGEIPDYQVAAWLMAVWFRGMDELETAALTRAMANSGEVLDFSAFPGTVVDKHSTGGVGDKTTLVLLPLVSAAGVKLAKISGRGLGHTGGTIDKLSAIPGFRTQLSREEFLKLVRENGLAIMGQTPQVAPADGKFYALRDVTATVDSIPLIASSVMSKKIAAGAQAILLDVKAGSGAFMRDPADARRLAVLMVAIGRKLGRRAVALVTAMDQPLGRAVGNHLEVIEALEILRGTGPEDLRELCLCLGTEMLLLGGAERRAENARARLAATLDNGTALAAMRRFIASQGGNPAIVDNTTLLGVPRFKREVFAPCDGYVIGLDARRVGRAAVMLGAGRARKEDEVDLLAGILLHKKCGDFVRSGTLLAEMFASRTKIAKEAVEVLSEAYTFGPGPPATSPLVFDRIE